MSSTSYHYTACEYPDTPCMCDEIAEAGGCPGGRNFARSSLHETLYPPTVDKQAEYEELKRTYAKTEKLFNEMYPVTPQPYRVMVHVNQEAPPTNRYMAVFPFPYDKLRGSGDCEQDAVEALYETLLARQKHDLVQYPTTPQGGDEASEGQPEPEFYTAIHASVCAPDELNETPSKLGAALVRGYEVTMGAFYFVQDVAAGDKWRNFTGVGVYPLVRLKAFEMEQQKVVDLERRLIQAEDATLDVKQKLRDMESFAGGLEQACDSMRGELKRLKGERGLLPVQGLANELAAALSRTGDIIVRAEDYKEYKEAHELLDYLADASLYIRWADHDSRPYVAKPEGSCNQGKKKAGYIAVCGYDDKFNPLAFDSIAEAIRAAMDVIQPCKLDEPQ